MWRELAGKPSGEMARVIFDSGAEAELFHAVEIVKRAIFHALGEKRFFFFFQALVLLGELCFDVFVDKLLATGEDHVVAGGEDRDLVEDFKNFAGDRMNFRDALDLIAEECYAYMNIFADRMKLDRVAAHPEAPADEGHVVAEILHVDELAKESAAVDILANLEMMRHLGVVGRRAEAVDTGNGGYNDHVAANHKGLCCGMAETVDLFVYIRIFFDIQIALGDISFGLVVIRDQETKYPTKLFGKNA